MNAKQAVAVAREHLIDVFHDELSGTPALEEVWFDDGEQEWCVTFALKRQTGAVVTLGTLVRPFDFKVVRVKEKDGQAVSIRDRSLLRDAS